MNKHNELKHTNRIVRKVLIEDRKARNSDMALYVRVCEEINPGALTRPFSHVLMHLKDYNLPNVETVRRARQKLQEAYPELAADADVEAQRMVNESTFRDYARERV